MPALEGLMAETLSTVAARRVVWPETWQAARHVVYADSRVRCEAYLLALHIQLETPGDLELWQI
jgi:hypothetical protein